MGKNVKKKGYKKILCQKCTGLCCRYFALPLDTPEDWDDYDDIRWYLYHEDVDIFVDEGDWYLNVRNQCTQLAKDDYKCLNYDMRPKICRGYTEETCDLTSEGDEGYEYDLHFKSPQQMEEYMKIKFGDKVFEKLEKKKKKKSKKKKK